MILASLNWEAQSGSVREEQWQFPSTVTQWKEKPWQVESICMVSTSEIISMNQVHYAEEPDAIRYLNRTIVSPLSDSATF